MTTYKGIHGLKVQHVTSDAISSQIAGGTWATGGSLNTGRGHGGSSKGGTQSAAIYFGGYPPTKYHEEQKQNLMMDLVGQK